MVMYLGSFPQFPKQIQSNPRGKNFPTQRIFGFFSVVRGPDAPIDSCAEASSDRFSLQSGDFGNRWIQKFPIQCIRSLISEGFTLHGLQYALHGVE